jgi:hypothetical protein
MAYIGQRKIGADRNQNNKEDRKMRKQLSNLAVSLFLITVITGLSFAQTRENPVGGRLEGTWNVRVSITNCQTGGVIRSFDSLGQFMPGGTLLDSTSGTAQALKTPGEGVWEHTTGPNYRFKFKSFTFDATGNYTGYTVIQHNATLANTGDSYESSGTLEVYNPAGVLVATGCSTTTATRFGF